MKILVVNDEKLVVKGIKFNLEHDGYEAVTAFDGESAVALTSSEKPDLVILDLMMPKLDGLEACMQIPRLLQRAHHHAHRSEHRHGQADGL